MHPCAGHPQRECVHTNKTFPSCVVTAHSHARVCVVHRAFMCVPFACVSHRHDVRGSMMYAGVSCIASVPFVCVSHPHDVRGCDMHSKCAIRVCVCVPSP